MATENASPKEIIKQDILVEKPWIVWFFMFAFWTIISLALTIQDYYFFFEHRKTVENFSLLTLPLNSFTYFYAWLSLTPLVFWFSKKFPIGRGKSSVRNLIIHIFLSILTAGIYLVLTSLLINLFVYTGEDFTRTLFNEVNKRSYVVGHFQVLIYWAILGAGFSFEYYKKYREREIEASRLFIRSKTLETQLAKAQLNSLKMQLHPHFLFNTLHAISALMDDSPKRARRMIARLGELLRTTLDIADEQTIALQKELALTKLYLEIEQERFGEMLNVNIEVSPDELGCFVPSLILQPLIENAIKHGIKDEEKTAIIKIKVKRANNQIRIFVEDNGPGFAEVDAMKLQDGIGLSNTKARLEQLYGKDHSFTIQNSEKGGAIVEISIPCSRKKN